MPKVDTIRKPQPVPTLFDLYATAALQGLLANPSPDVVSMNNNSMVNTALSLANYMVRKRSGYVAVEVASER